MTPSESWSRVYTNVDSCEGYDGDDDAVGHGAVAVFECMTNSTLYRATVAAWPTHYPDGAPNLPDNLERWGDATVFWLDTVDADGEVTDTIEIEYGYVSALFHDSEEDAERACERYVSDERWPTLYLTDPADWKENR
tara:strand:+ start:95 stop:505 length:411 start_codon:yes stop_codon:yes gene_type:complete